MEAKDWQLLCKPAVFACSQHDPASPHTRTCLLQEDSTQREAPAAEAPGTEGTDEAISGLASAAEVGSPLTGLLSNSHVVRSAHGSNVMLPHPISMQASQAVSLQQYLDCRHTLLFAGAPQLKGHFC